MSKFLHNDGNDDNDDAKGIAIPRVFSDNSRPKNDTHLIAWRCFCRQHDDCFDMLFVNERPECFDRRVGWGFRNNDCILSFTVLK